MVENRMREFGLMRFEDEDKDKDEIKGFIWVYNHIDNKRRKDWENVIIGLFRKKMFGRFEEQMEAFDERLNKMDKEYASMLRNALQTKKCVVGKGFCYFLNKFKKSDLLGTCLGACISAAIASGMRQGEACIVHGQKGIDMITP
ncbi:hypothetical protein Tco_1339484 [Tanacetum coccineum]